MNFDVLNGIYLFKEHSPDELKKITSICESASYNIGEEIFTKGEKASCLYVIRLGSVRIHISGKNGEKFIVANLSTGSHFGEMALVDGEPRSANAETSEKTELIKFDYIKLNKLLLENPLIGVKFYKSLCQFLSGRLRVTTNDFSFAKEKNLRHF